MSRCISVLFIMLTILLLPCLVTAQAAAWNFETGDMQGWQVLSGGFERLLCDRATFHHTGEPYNHEGKYFLSTLESTAYTPNDAFQGVVQSPQFTITEPYLSMLVGGGAGMGEFITLVLVDEDEEVRIARGGNAQTMYLRIWDVQEFIGKTAFIRLVDRESGGWGHITLDDIRVPTAEELVQVTPDTTRPAAVDIDAMKVQIVTRLTSLRTAILYLQTAYGEKYPQANEYLQKTDALAVIIPESDSKSALRKALNARIKEINDLGREALIINNPTVNRAPILYVAREQYRRDHHNTETMFINGAQHGGFVGGSALRVLDPVTGEIKTLLDAPEGIIRDPDVSFDGTKILISYRQNAADEYHLWVMNADGSDLRQLTFGAEISDTDPAWLPDGRIVFSSTRDPKVCACNVHRQANLFTMNPDGSNILQVSGNTLFDSHSSMMPDGRVLYTRWEYVDKHFGPAQGLWTMNPDGTNHATFWHNNAWWPGAVLDGKAVPGTDYVIATLGSCHAPPFGEIAVIDRQLGFEGELPLVKSWPQEPVRRGNDYDHVWGLSLRYEDPCPLDNTFFLASRTIERVEINSESKYGLYLLDMMGNEILVHADEKYSVFDPMPLTPRPIPRDIPARTDLKAGKEGTFFVYDVYRGTGMQSVKPGAVKWLRIVESPPKRFISFGEFNLAARQAPVMNWADVVNKRIIGKVPVEADGSAYFKAPTDKFLFFQLLDEKGMMIQSMRSGAVIQPDETMSCIGCHDERNTTVSVDRRAAALKREPSKAKDWYGAPREFNFATEVQPVLDNNCVRCHDFGKSAGKVLNLSGDKTLLFNFAYLDMHRKSGTTFTLDPPEAQHPFIKVVNHGPPEVLPAYSWGSHRSKIIDVILQGHHGVKLDAESFDRLVTWIDLNAVYYGSFACERPDNYGGRSPLDWAQLNRLRDLTGIDVANEIVGSWVNLTRPEFSPCLTLNLPIDAGGEAEPGKAQFTGKADPAYAEALEIIRASQQELIRLPRMDMPGDTVPLDSRIIVSN